MGSSTRSGACSSGLEAEEPDGWLNVYGWEPLSMASPPTRRDLDDLPTRRPILVTDTSSHTSVANSRALELSGVDAKTPDPGAGRIGRGDRNEPNGLLYDEAIVLVSGHIPPDTPEQNRRALRGAHEQMARMGVTSYLDVWTRGPELEAHTTLSDAGKLLVRPALSLEVTPTGAADTEALLARLDRLRKAHGRPGIGMRTVKLFLDGVIEHPAQTAAMLEPYWTGTGGPARIAAPPTSPGADRPDVAALDGAGWQVHMHAIGDRAVRSALDAVEFARERNGPSGHRHTIAHVQMVDPADFGRFGKLDVMASMQAQWARWDIYTVERLRPYVGDERWRNTYPFPASASGDQALRGKRLAGRSPLSPFARSRRRSPGRPLNPYAPRASPCSLRRGSPSRSRCWPTPPTLRSRCTRRGPRGRCGRGCGADLIVLDRDLFEVLPDEVHETEVLLTAVDGEIVHRDGSL